MSSLPTAAESTSNSTPASEVTAPTAADLRSPRSLAISDASPMPSLLPHSGGGCGSPLPPLVSARNVPHDHGDDYSDDGPAPTEGGVSSFGLLATSGPLPRPVVDLDRIRRAVGEILAAIGEDPQRDGLLDTPQRVARMYAEVFQGLHQDPREHLRTVFAENCQDMVLVRDIPFVSFCEHHLLPFVGKVHVAYLPNGPVLGLSKIPRVVDVLSRRPQVQERLTADLANLIYKEVDVLGVAVMVEATHSCMTIRGVSKPGSSCQTFALRGVFQDDPHHRAEVLTLLNNN